MQCISNRARVCVCVFAHAHTPASPVPDKSKEPESRQFVGLVIGILTTVIVMLLAAITFIFYRNRRLKAALTPPTFYDQQGDHLKVGVYTS